MTNESSPVPDLNRYYWMELFLRLPEEGVAYAYPTEEECRRRMQELRWPQGVTCLKCAGENVGFMPSRLDYFCRSCGHHYKVYTGTALGGRRVAMRTLYLAAEEFIRLHAIGKPRFMTNEYTRNFLGVANMTAIKIKKAVRADLEPGGQAFLLGCLCETQPAAATFAHVGQEQFQAALQAVTARNRSRRRN